MCVVVLNQNIFFLIPCATQCMWGHLLGQSTFSSCSRPLLLGVNMDGENVFKEWFSCLVTFFNPKHKELFCHKFKTWLNVTCNNEFWICDIHFFAPTWIHSHQRSSFFDSRFQGIETSGRQVPQIIWVKQGHVGLTTNTIILKDLYHLMYSLLLESHGYRMRKIPTPKIEKYTDSKNRPTVLRCQSWVSN